MDIHLLLNGDNYTLDTVKLAILYFDKVIIDIPSYIGDIHINYEEHSIFLEPVPYFFPFEKQLKSFAKDGLVELYYFHLADKGRGKNAKEVAKSLSSSNIITGLKFAENGNSMNYSLESEILSDEINETISNMSSLEVAKFLKGYADIVYRKNDNGRNVILAITIYEVLFSYYIQSIANTTIPVTNSEIVTQIAQRKSIDFARSDTEKASCMEICSVLLPNISQFSIEDIIDIKYHSNDILIELRHYIESLIDVENMYDKKACERIITEKINPTIQAFQTQIENLKISTKQKIVQNILSYKPLVPLFVSAITDIPSFLGGLVTAGLVAEDVLLEYKKQKNSIIQDKTMSLLFKLRDNNLL